MSNPGYYRYPTLHEDTVVFVCEDDLWTVPAEGGIARRLTANLGEVSSPALSPDGQWLAFTGREEGHAEVYVMPALGGPAQRLTYLGADARVVGWHPGGDSILFASNVGRAFDRQVYLYAISSEGGENRLLPTGPAVSISFGPQGGQVIGRHAIDLSWWKRYRGGRAGDLWIDVDGDGQWRRLCGAPVKNGLGGLELDGNVALPMWLGARVYFLSDHEGVGNLYSCLPNGEDLRRHTDHDQFYVRHAVAHDQRIIYSAGGEIYIYDSATGSSQLVPVSYYSPRVQRNRRFVRPARHLHSYDIHPKGHSVALVSRGQVFTMANWEGAVRQHGETHVDASGVAVAVRRRLATWLFDGQHLVTVGDGEGEESLELHPAGDDGERRRLSGLGIGRPVLLVASPRRYQVALSNHRHELVLVDLDSGTVRVLDRSPYGRLRGLAWSPDGRWLAYGYPNTSQTSIIRLCQIDTGEVWDATRPVLRDEEPAFDPEGKYLYFLSARDFDPVYDSLHFDLNFPQGMRPYLIILQRDVSSPFIPEPRAPGEKDAAAEEADKVWRSDSLDSPSSGESGVSPEGPDEADRSSAGVGDGERPESETRIDLEGITDRIVAFPVDNGLYDQIRGMAGKVLFSSWPVEGTLADDKSGGLGPPAKGLLEVYDFADQKLEQLVDGVSSFELSMDGKNLIYRARNRLRVIRAGEKPSNKTGAGPGRESGWIDLGRLKVSVDPAAEWAQMFRHAWRLQRDQFWTEDMSGVDWQQVYLRYWPLVSRISTRSEFSDLMWEMQGELGTSHAYEFGGDYRPQPRYDQGFLATDLTFDSKTGGWQVTHIVRGDSWDEHASSPLAGPGLDVSVGDVLVAIGGRPLGARVSPQQLLVNQAGEEVLLTFAGGDGSKPRSFAVKCLRSERLVRYREWVEASRRHVHQATEGRVGYVHVPDMGPEGYAEFHRGYLAEVTREALIVDVRFNRGGHVSQLLLEKLARRRIGYDVQRWGQPDPYPADSVLGPMVALTNEYAGSDGDVFCHAFKVMKLGPLIGKRTWGGVIGISPREDLVDGGVTTQPEYSFWLEDIGWGLENRGAEPDIEVEITPEDYLAGRDPQLDRAVEETLRLLTENPPHVPDFGNRPRRDLPQLPAA